MEYIKNFNRGKDVLSVDEIILAKSFKELVKDDYSRAYVFGMCAKELMKKHLLTKELEEDLLKAKKIPEGFVEATDETIEVLKEYEDIMGEKMDSIPPANYILTVLNRHGYTNEVLVLISFFLGQSTLVSETVK